MSFKLFFNVYKKKIILGLCAFVCLCLLLIVLLISNRYNAEEIEYVNDFPASEESTIINETVANDIVENEIHIDVKGAVKNPGVYVLKDNARVLDAIEAAGGLLKSAYTRYLNLSKVLKDEYVVLVNTKAEIDELLKKVEPNVIVKEVVKEVPCESTPDVCICEEKLVTSEINETYEENKTENTQESFTANSKVNINTATINELMTLEGVGESKAKKIIEYRDANGGFSKIEDIKNVSGIGDKMYESIKENITV